MSTPLDWRQVQQWLRDHGYYPAGMAIDGIPQGATRQALLAMRRARSLAIGDSLAIDKSALLIMGLPIDSVIPPPWMPVLAEHSTLLGDTEGPCELDDRWSGALMATILTGCGYMPTPSNPYDPASWGLYGVEADLAFGTIVVTAMGVGFALRVEGGDLVFRAGVAGMSIGTVHVPLGQIAHKRLPAGYVQHGGSLTQPPINL